MSDYPYCVIRIQPGVYYYASFGEEVTHADFRRGIQKYSLIREVRCCLVLDKERCIYYEPDGTKTASDKIPQGGLRIWCSNKEWARDVYYDVRDIIQAG